MRPIGPAVIRGGILLSLLLSSACAPMTVGSFAARGVVFSQYHTYAWAQDPARATGDPRLDNNRFFLERIQADAERQLAARGFEKSAPGASDLVLHYHASATQQLDVAAADRQYGPCTACPQASLFEAGTILFDLVDARTNLLIWRGWADTSLENVIDNQDLLDAEVDRAVARIVATIPGRL